MDKILAEKFTLRRCLIGDTAYRHSHKWKWPCTPSTASRQIGVRVRNVVRFSTGDQKRKFERRENAGPAPLIGVQERIGDPNCVLNLNLTSAGTGAGSCSRRQIKTLMNFMETAGRRSFCLRINPECPLLARSGHQLVATFKSRTIVVINKVHSKMVQLQQIDLKHYQFSSVIFSLR